MTDQEKIERLAKWMDSDKIKFMHITFQPDSYRCLKGGYWLVWNPLTNIADAWMLVEKATATRTRLYDFIDWWDRNGNLVVRETASEAARAISEAVLEVI